MKRFWNKLNEESASAVVENIIVLPLIFVVILFMIVTAFLLHDRAAIEAAARRGATYAAHCIADPNYASLVGQYGMLDISEDFVDDETGDMSFDFSGLGKNIHAYRYITGGPDVENVVVAEVKKIISNTRLPWTSQDSIRVDYDQENKIIYQNITITVTATYHIPSWYRLFGLDTEFELSTEAKVAAVDPDEFIRNADLVVDLITRVDQSTGGYVAKAIDSIRSLGDKLLEWIDMG